MSKVLCQRAYGIRGIFFLRLVEKATSYGLVVEKFLKLVGAWCEAIGYGCGSVFITREDSRWWERMKRLLVVGGKLRIMTGLFIR